FMDDPVGLRASFLEDTKKVRETISSSRELLGQVTTPTRMLELISRICIDFNIDGHRGDIIIERTARTNAALEGRTEVATEDIIAAAELALPHRMRKQPFEEDDFNASLLHKLVRGYEKDGVV
ncbi:MAG: magnesium chelatase, partial [Thermoplasmata archaeon]|nr:magnesium chelatase [Thermoplasmata archaeon]